MTSLLLCARSLTFKLCHCKHLGNTNQIRNLNLLEYQGKDLLATHGITVQKFKLLCNHAEADNIAHQLPSEEYVVKAQIHAGGRGVGVFSNGFKGGIHLTKNPAEVKHLVKQMLGNRLITKQTPTEGSIVNKVMVAESVDIARETYFSIILDGAHSSPIILASALGGVDIENVSQENPSAIKVIPIDIYKGVTHDIALETAEVLQFKGETKELAAKEIIKLWEFFIAVDAIQVEINPLAECKKRKVYAIDAKIKFDDNAQFRQKQIFDLEDISEIDPRELQASKFNLNYIPLKGNIGCLVNGAGLAMATMDIIKLQGGEPANFLDVGGGVNETKVIEAFKILSADNQVQVILVNIFGGIVNCVTIANGIISACGKSNIKVPLIIRLEGTNVLEARKILKDSGLQFINAIDLQDAAEKAFASIKN